MLSVWQSLFYSCFFCPTRTVSFTCRSVSFYCNHGKRAIVNSFYKPTGGKKKILVRMYGQSVIDKDTVQRHPEVVYSDQFVSDTCLGETFIMEHLSEMKGCNHTPSQFQLFLETSADNTNSIRLWELQFTKTELFHYYFKCYPRFQKGNATNTLKCTVKKKNKSGGKTSPT